METSSVASGSTVAWRRSSPALLGSDTRTITSPAFPRRRRGATPPYSPRYLRWSGYSTPSPGLHAPLCILLPRSAVSATTRRGVAGGHNDRHAHHDVHVHAQRLVTRDRAEDVVAALLEGHGELRALPRREGL